MVQKGSLWLFYAGSLAGRQKKNLRKSAKIKADSLGEKQLGKLGEKPVTERKREHTDLRLDLSEIEEQFTCYALALAMTNEARREAEM